MLPLPLISLIADLVPTAIGWFSDDKETEKKAAGVIDIVKQVTGLSDNTMALENLRANPEMQIRFKEAFFTFQLSMEQERTKQLEAVNKTMQAESKSEHWMQWSWRPFNGFLFGITLFLGYIVPALTNVILAAANVVDKVAVNMLMVEQVRTVPIADIPEFALVAWGAILGVTSWHRGRKQVAQVEQDER